MVRSSGARAMAKRVSTSPQPELPSQIMEPSITPPPIAFSRSHGVAMCNGFSAAPIQIFLPPISKPVFLQRLDQTVQYTPHSSAHFTLWPEQINLRTLPG